VNSSAPLTIFFASEEMASYMGCMGTTLHQLVFIETGELHHNPIYIHMFPQTVTV